MRTSPALSPSTARRPSRERRIGPISCPVLPKRFRLRRSAVLVGRVPPAFSRQARSARCASATATCTGDRSARPPRHLGKSRRTSGRSGRGRHPCAPHRDPPHPSRIRPPLLSSRASAGDTIQYGWPVVAESHAAGRSGRSGLETGAGGPLYSRASMACPAARPSGPPAFGEAEALAKPGRNA